MQGIPEGWIAFETTPRSGTSSYVALVPTQTDSSSATKSGGGSASPQQVDPLYGGLFTHQRLSTSQHSASYNFVPDSLNSSLYLPTGEIGGSHHQGTGVEQPAFLVQVPAPAAAASMPPPPPPPPPPATTNMHNTMNFVPSGWAASPPAATGQPQYVYSPGIEQQQQLVYFPQQHHHHHHQQWAAPSTTIAGSPAQPQLYAYGPPLAHAQQVTYIAMPPPPPPPPSSMMMAGHQATPPLPTQHVLTPTARQVTSVSPPQSTAAVPAKKPSLSDSDIAHGACRQLMVHYLSPNVNSTMLAQLFAPFGKLQGARIIYDRRTNQPRGYGFVYFELPEDAQKAQRAMNGVQVHDKWLKVEFTNNPLHVFAKAPSELNQQQQQQQGRNTVDTEQE